MTVMRNSERTLTSGSLGDAIRSHVLEAYFNPPGHLVFNVSRCTMREVWVWSSGTCARRLREEVYAQLHGVGRTMLSRVFTMP